MRQNLIFATALTFCTSILLLAADGPQRIEATPGMPGPMRQPMMNPQMVGGMGGYDVESVLIPAGSSAARAMATWAELAAQGFKVVGTVPTGDATLVLLERSSAMGGGKPHVPQAVATDAGASEALTGRLQAIRDERQQAMRTAMNQWQTQVEGAPSSHAGAGSVTPVNAPDAPAKK